MKILALTAILITVFVMFSYSLTIFVKWKANRKTNYLLMSIIYFLGMLLNVYVYIYVVINGLEKL